MRISHAALNRIVEGKMASDSKYKKDLERKKRPVLANGRALSDTELTDMLRSCGISFDRERLDQESRRFLSAENLARSWTEEEEFPDGVRYPEDWVWICLTVLWERWFPDHPNLEMLDDKIQEGYRWLEKKDEVRACEVWLKAWEDYLALAHGAGVKTIRDFDDLFGGTQSIFNWVQDLETELHNAGLEDKRFFEKRIVMCSTYLDKHAAENELIAQNMRRALAESYFELGQPEKGEEHYKKWLADDPKWGWGWIGWSDNYGLFCRAERRDGEKAVRILREALRVDGVRDRKQILERLEDVYKDTGKGDEANVIRREIRLLDSNSDRNDRAAPALTSGHNALDFSMVEPEANPILLRSEKKVGRNEPCPCRSGKKFKKCCGANLK